MQDLKKQPDSADWCAEGLNKEFHGTAAWQNWKKKTDSDDWSGQGLRDALEDLNRKPDSGGCLERDGSCKVMSWMLINLCCNVYPISPWIYLSPKRNGINILMIERKRIKEQC